MFAVKTWSFKKEILGLDYENQPYSTHCYDADVPGSLDGAGFS